MLTISSLSCSIHRNLVVMKTCTIMTLGGLHITALKHKLSCLFIRYTQRSDFKVIFEAADCGGIKLDCIILTVFNILFSTFTYISECQLNIRKTCNKTF